MSGPETVERLTAIIAEQARIIGQLYSGVEQLNATTSLAPDIEAIQAEAGRITENSE